MLGDAPPRGTQYCLHKIWCRMENTNDLKGPQSKDIISKMKKNGIIYNILMINNKLNKMVNAFRQLEGTDEKMINTFEMKDGLKFETITHFVINQIKTAVENQKKSKMI